VTQRATRRAIILRRLRILVRAKAVLDANLWRLPMALRIISRRRAAARIRTFLQSAESCSRIQITVRRFVKNIHLVQRRMRMAMLMLRAQVDACVIAYYVYEIGQLTLVPKELQEGARQEKLEKSRQQRMKRLSLSNLTDSTDSAEPLGTDMDSNGQGPPLAVPPASLYTRRRSKTPLPDPAAAAAAAALAAAAEPGSTNGVRELPGTPAKVRLSPAKRRLRGQTVSAGDRSPTGLALPMKRPGGRLSASQADISAIDTSASNAALALSGSPNRPADRLTVSELKRAKVEIISQDLRMRRHAHVAAESEWKQACREGDERAAISLVILKEYVAATPHAQQLAAELLAATRNAAATAAAATAVRDRKGGAAEEKGIYSRICCSGRPSGTVRTAPLDPIFKDSMTSVVLQILNAAAILVQRVVGGRSARKEMRERSSVRRRQSAGRAASSLAPGLSKLARRPSPTRKPPTSGLAGNGRRCD